MKRLVMWSCARLWCFCEAHGISLGRFAPYVFGGMLGAWPHRVKDHKP